MDHPHPFIQSSLGFTGRILLGLALLLAAAGPAKAALDIRFVTPTGADSGNCMSSPCRSIKYALSQAVDTDTIRILPGDYPESEVSISKNVVIEGTDRAGVFIHSASGLSGVFSVSTGTSVLFRHLTIAHSGSPSLTHAAGIVNSGTADIVDCDISDNEASHSAGGAIYNAGIMTITDSMVSFNKNGSGGTGGAIYNYTGASLTITRTYIWRNFGSMGGALANRGTITIDDSEIIGNYTQAGTFGQGGGVHNNGVITLNRSTISFNEARYERGGGIYNFNGTITLNHSTLNDNAALTNAGGGIVNDAGTVNLNFVTMTNNTAVGSGGGIYRTGGTVNVKNSILSGNTLRDASATPSDCAGAVTSLDYNVVKAKGSCPFDAAHDLSGVDALVGIPGSYGGETSVAPIFHRSAAIDLIPGGVNGCEAGLTDQRGMARPVDHGTGANCDAGAFELQASETSDFISGLVEGASPVSIGETGVSVARNTGSADPGTIAAMRILEMPPQDIPDAEDLGVFWDITASGSTYDLALTLCYSDALLPALPENRIRMYRYGDAGWEQQYGAVLDEGGNCVTQPHVTELSLWSLGAAYYMAYAPVIKK